MDRIIIMSVHDIIRVSHGIWTYILYILYIHISYISYSLYIYIQVARVPRIIQEDLTREEKKDVEDSGAAGQGLGRARVGGLWRLPGEAGVQNTVFYQSKCRSRSSRVAFGSMTWTLTD